MGPFELFDLTGLDVSHPVMESIYRQFYEEPRFRPSPATAQRLAAGVLGRKSGHGFYDYRTAGTAAVAPTPVAGHAARLAWIGHGEPQARAAVMNLGRPRSARASMRVRCASGVSLRGLAVGAKTQRLRLWSRSSIPCARSRSTRCSSSIAIAR
jgi:3-hydroxyacyl-CoA dehydrogenase